MTNHSDVIKKILSTHAAGLLFDAKFIESSSAKVLVGFSAQKSLLASGLSVIVDFMARVGGYESLQESYLSEYELNTYVQAFATEIVASVKIESTSNESALFFCEIFAVENSRYNLLAEAQGTLLKINCLLKQTA